MAILIPKHRHFIDGDRIYHDCETTGKSAYRGDRPFAFSFANDGGDEICFEFDVDPLTRKPKYIPSIVEKMKRLLEDPAIAKVGFNWHFDKRMHEIAFGTKVAGRQDDVMWMAHAANSSEMRHGLKPLMDKYAKGAIDNDDETILHEAVKACRAKNRKLKWKIAIDEADEEESTVWKADFWLPNAVFRLAPEAIRKELLARFPDLEILNKIYATKDAVRTGLGYWFYTGIMDQEDLWGVYEREIRTAPITYRSEAVGVRIFPDRCVELGQRCQSEMAKLRVELSKIFGSYNVKVPDSKIRTYLFSPPPEGLGKKVLKMTSGGKSGKKAASVDKSVKEFYAAEVPAIGNILEHDRYKKVWHDYVQKYMAHGVNDGTGQIIIHAGVRQIGAITGRMSVADPPLHQIPKRAKAGSILKQARYPFGPRKRCVWIHYDYKSIEPRITAEEADEKDILECFNNGMACPSVEGGWTYDPYEILVDRVAVATGWGRKRLEELFEPRGGARQVCKNNFLGWTYGEGTTKMSREMGTDIETGYRIIEALKAAFRGVQPFMEHMQALAKEQGWIRNRYGRKAVIPPPIRKLDDDGLWRWVEFWYKATNYLIQGTAADLLKEAAIRLGGIRDYYDRYNKLSPQKVGFLTGTGAEIVLYVHDELIIEVPFKLAMNEKFVRRIGEIMADNQGMFKKVATPVDGRVTWRAWSDPEELETLWD